MTNLLISGSRAATRAMIEEAEKATLRAIGRDWSIHVGDAAGVDAVVARTCIRKEYHFTCYGISSVCRLIQHQKNIELEWLSPDEKRLFHTLASYVHVQTDSFLRRDEVAVEAVDCVYAIWNGLSRGTKYTADYAAKLQKQVWIWDYRRFLEHDRSFKRQAD